MTYVPDNAEINRPASSITAYEPGSGQWINCKINDEAAALLAMTGELTTRHLTRAEYNSLDARDDTILYVISES